jgi:hypothetical protein
LTAQLRLARCRCRFAKNKEIEIGRAAHHRPQICVVIYHKLKVESEKKKHLSHQFDIYRKIMQEQIRSKLLAKF